MIIFINNDMYKYLTDEQKENLKSNYTHGGHKIPSVIGAYHGEGEYELEEDIEVDGVIYEVCDIDVRYETRPINNGTLDKVVQVFLKQ